MVEGALVASLGLAGGLSKKATSLAVILVGFSIMLGSLLSFSAFHIMKIQFLIFPLATGVLLYVSMTHLLPIAVKAKKGVIGVIVGVAIICQPHIITKSLSLYVSLGFD